MQRWIIWAAAIAAAAAGAIASAQSYPATPIRIVIGFDVVAGTPEQFGRFMKNEVERWALVVRRGGIKAD